MISPSSVIPLKGEGIVKSDEEFRIDMGCGIHDKKDCKSTDRDGGFKGRIYK